MPRIDLSAVEEARHFELPATIGSGQRNVTMHRYASSLQALGVGDAEMLALCEHANDTRCDPPLPPWEVASVVRSAQRYPKGAPGARAGSFRPLADETPVPCVSGEGRPDLLPDLSGMGPAEMARAWVRACFHEGDVVCLVRDYRDPTQEFRLLAGELTGLVGGFDPLPSILPKDRGMGWWAVCNPLATLDSPRRDSEVGRYHGELAGESEVALPDGSVGIARSWRWSTAPAYHHVLVECDSLPPEEQLERICALFLHGRPDVGRLPPIDAITWSGGKSYHVMVRCGGSSREEHDDRVRWLYRYCDENGLLVDHHCGNPSRLTRLPGARRGGEMQGLIWCRGL